MQQRIGHQLADHQLSGVDEVLTSCGQHDVADDAARLAHALWRRREPSLDLHTRPFHAHEPTGTVRKPITSREA